MKDVLDSMNVKQSKPVVEVAKSELEIYRETKETEGRMKGSKAMNMFEDGLKTE